MDFINDNLRVILLALIGVIAGITITMRIIKYKNSNNDNSNKNIQHNNSVGGDMAGRDINKK